MDYSTENSRQHSDMEIKSQCRPLEGRSRINMSQLQSESNRNENTISINPIGSEKSENTGARRRMKRWIMILTCLKGSLSGGVALALSAMLICILYRNRVDTTQASDGSYSDFYFGTGKASIILTVTMLTGFLAICSFPWLIEFTSYLHVNRIVSLSKAKQRSKWLTEEEFELYANLIWGELAVPFRLTRSIAALRQGHSIHIKMAYILHLLLWILMPVYPSIS
jgi:hypothetical protein